eukprot:jgi/Astpho2/6230/Aster-03636
MTGRPKMIGVIMGTTRPGANCQPISRWVYDLASTAGHNGTEFELVDLATFALPLLDEPGIPAMHPPVHDHTKAWQQKVDSLHGMVFVTPQYNWGYPAALKNAVDYLYHSWNGKPAMIVSYGSHGGGKGAAQLNQVLQGLKMNVVPTMPGLKLTRQHQLEGVILSQAPHDFAAHRDDVLQGIAEPAILVSLGLTAATGCGLLWSYSPVQEEEKLQQKRIGIIMGTTRPGANCQPISRWVYDLASSAGHKDIEFELVDLASFALPLLDEPGIPAMHPPVHHHTKAWQQKVDSLHGMVFVTPQYNWGYPAALKNALDYLYRSWNGKPAMIVSYGSHGGGKGAAQLKQVLQGLKMNVVPTMPGLMLTIQHQLEGVILSQAPQDFAAHREDVLQGIAEVHQALTGPGN